MIAHFFLVPSFFFLFPALQWRVTDKGLCALASSGCGRKLTSLSLSCECLYFFVLWFIGMGMGEGDACD